VKTPHHLVDEHVGNKEQVEEAGIHSGDSAF
jgi:hypothetical protein